MGFDEVYVRVGDFGLYQKRVLLFLSLLCIPSGLYALFAVFGDTDPQSWTCNRSAGVAAQEVVSEEQKCELWKSGDCQPEYQAERNSTVTEWNLVCGDRWKKGLPVSALFVGVGVGSWASGLLSDRIGRRVVTLWSSLLGALAALSTALSWNLLSYTATRFIQGAVAAGVLPVPFVLMGELARPSARETCGNILQAMFAVGMVMLCCLALIIKNWRTLAIACSLPGLILTPILWRHIPESPRWLLVQGRIKECEVLLESIAKTNGRSVVNIQLDESKTTKHVDTNKQKKSEGVLDLFRNAVMKRRVVIMLFYWFVTSLVYYGLSMNASIGPNIYVSFFCASLVEFPSYFASVYLLRIQGRRKSTALFTAIGCVSLLICVLLSSGNLAGGSTQLSLSMLAKFGLGSTFANLYVYGGELTPTSVRNMTLGILSVGARAGGVVLPYVMMLDQVYESLPYAVFGVLCLLAMLIGLLLPETLNTELPQTLNELSDGRHER